MKLSLLSAIPLASMLGACAGTLPAPTDLDQDGVGDVADRCPAENEDGADPEPADGCVAVEVAK